MRMFKTVPCLVLDDLGHENMTAARGEECGEEYIKPIVSRVLECGKWVLIETGEDYLRKRGAEV